jgi:hypothetical protein
LSNRISVLSDDKLLELIATFEYSLGRNARVKHEETGIGSMLGRLFESDAAAAAEERPAAGAGRGSDLPDGRLSNLRFPSSAAAAAAPAPLLPNVAPRYAYAHALAPPKPITVAVKIIDKEAYDEEIVEVTKGHITLIDPYKELTLTADTRVSVLDRYKASLQNVTERLNPKLVQYLFLVRFNYPESHHYMDSESKHHHAVVHNDRIIKRIIHHPEISHEDLRPRTPVIEETYRYMDTDVREITDFSDEVPAVKALTNKWYLIGVEEGGGKLRLVNVDGKTKTRISAWKVRKL